MNQARHIAFSILCQVAKGPQTLDHFLEKADPRISPLNRPDRSLVHALVYGTLRWQRRLDFIIDHFARNPKKIELPIRILLRLGLFQMNYMDRIPLSAVVHTTVELTKKTQRPWASGLVNGILRRAAETQASVPWPDPEKEPALALSVEQAVPRWLAERWIARWGLEETRQLCKAINTIPSVTLRINTLKTDRHTLMAAIASEAAAVARTSCSPEGIIVDSFARPFSQWPAFQKGCFQIQDEAAQLVTHLLGPQPGHAVWDACAGLGTKAAHCAQMMDNRGTILATDLQAPKLQRLQVEMRRMGINIVTTQVLDLTSASIEPEARYDRILVDAPCSGLGVLHKNPDGKWRIPPHDLTVYQQRQILLLERVAPHLKPNGILVYAVCSFEPEENQAVINGFLQKHAEFAIHISELAAVDQLSRY